MYHSTIISFKNVAISLARECGKPDNFVESRGHGTFILFIISSWHNYCQECDQGKCFVHECTIGQLCLSSMWPYPLLMNTVNQILLLSQVVMTHSLCSWNGH